MPNYVDAFIIPIKSKNLKEYKRIAKIACEVWIKHGALSYYECFMDDYSQYGMGFKKMCKLKPNETSIFSFIIYKSKKHRTQVNKKVMKEFSKSPPIKMPFNMKRFAMAGCKVLVDSDK